MLLFCRVRYSTFNFSQSFLPSRQQKGECGEKEEEKEENEREQALDLNNNILSNTGVLDCSIKMLWFRPI